MDLITKIKEKVRALQLSLVLPEAGDIRVLQAAEIIIKERLVTKLFLLGAPDIIAGKAKEAGIDLAGCELHDYLKSPDLSTFAEDYYNLRKEKGITEKEAREIVADPLYYGMFMVREGRAGTAVCGSLATTADVLRACIHIIGQDSTSRSISSSFLMIIPNCRYGEEGALFFADAGAVPDPSAEQLADIAINTGKTAKVVLATEPKIAMLSFSTKGSAKHRLISKVVKATELARQKAPDLLIDGELQGDSALVPEIASRKLSQSPVAGQANVLIFPDLNSGNICYKLVERLANARAYGPLIQGTNIPISDLSRGCTAEDIVNISAVTLLRAGVR